MAQNRQDIGAWAERLACRYLEQQGLKRRAANYRCRSGEIDLIMEKSRLLVFVEVRFRGREGRVSAAESVHYRKQQKLINTAAFYMHRYKLTGAFDCRFDVVAITGGYVSGQPHIEWIVGAFQLP